MTTDMGDFVLTAPSQLDTFHNELTEMMDRHKLPGDKVSDIMVIVDELLSNLLKYGGGDRLELRFKRKKHLIELQCIDNGAPFNPLEASRGDLDQPVDQRDIGGLGIELIMAMTGTQEYNYDGHNNRLTLTLSID